MKKLSGMFLCLAVTLQPDQGVSAAIRFFYSTAIHISSNKFIGISSTNENYHAAGSAVDLLFSDQNDVRNNIIVGMNGISLRSCNNNHIVGNSSTGPKTMGRGQGGIALQNWSNNNVIENNMLDYVGSASLFIWQSKHKQLFSCRISVIIKLHKSASQ